MLRRYRSCPLQYNSAVSVTEGQNQEHFTANYISSVPNIKQVCVESSGEQSEEATSVT